MKHRWYFVIGYICGVLLGILLFNCGFQKNFVYSTAKTVVSNPHVQRYGGMFAYGMFAYRNADVANQNNAEFFL